MLFRSQYASAQYPTGGGGGAGAIGANGGNNVAAAGGIGVISSITGYAVYYGGGGGGGFSVTNGGGSISIANTGVTSAVAGTGISVSGATGAVTITNSGVTSVSAGTGVTLGATTGACSISIGQAVATSSNVQFNSIGVNTAGSGTAGEIRATNNITAYYSDARLKNFEGTIPNALEKVLSLNGYYFTENEVAKSLGYNNDARQVGVSAQEVEAIMPEVIADAPINGNFPGADYKTVHYEKLVPLLIEAIKEQQKQIEELKVKLGN